MGQRREIFGETTKYLVATIVSGLLAIMQAFLIARVLGPYLFGAWTILMIILSYNVHAHFGLVHGMNKEMPYLRGKGEPEQAERARDNCFWAICIIAIVASIILIILSFALEDSLAPELIKGLRILAGVTFLRQIYIFLASLLRADKKFGTLSVFVTLFAALSILFVLLYFFTFTNKLYAAILALLSGYLLANAFVFFRTRYKFKLSLDRSVIKHLFITGLPLIFIDIGYILFVSIDRWMIAGMINQEHVGYYGVALAIANFLFTASSVLAAVLYPRMLERYGQTQDPKESRQLVYTPTIATAYLMVLACALACFVTPLLIHYIVPAYDPSSINPALILIIGVFFISVMTVSGNFLVSINKQNTILKLQAVAIPLSIGLNYGFIKWGLGIEGVAIATGITYLFYGTSIVVLGFRNLAENSKELLRQMLKLYLPFLAVLPLIYFLPRLFQIPYTGLGDDILAVAIQIAIFLALTTPLILYLNKVTGAFNLLRQIIRSKAG